VRGEKHIDVANGLTNLGMLYLLRNEPGDLATAEPILRQSLEMKLGIHGPIHTSVANTEESLADLYLAKQDWSQAEDMAKKSLEVRREKLRPGHPNTLESIDMVADALEKQAKFKDAEPFRREAYETRHKTMPAGSWQIADNASRLGENLLRQDRPRDAEEFLRFGYEQLKSSTEPKVAAKAAERLLEFLQSTQKGDEVAALKLEIAKLNGGPTPP